MARGIIVIKKTENKELFLKNPNTGEWSENSNEAYSFSPTDIGLRKAIIAMKQYGGTDTDFEKL